MAEKVIRGFFAPMFRGHTEKTTRAPMIKLSVVAPGWTPASGVPPAVKALVDTGATDCFIHHQLAKDLSLPTSRTDTVRGIESNYQATAYLALLLNEEVSEITKVEIVPGDFSEKTHTLVVGWRFLQFYSLELSQKSDLVALTSLRKS